MEKEQHSETGKVICTACRTLPFSSPAAQSKWCEELGAKADRKPVRGFGQTRPSSLGGKSSRLVDPV
uniref:Uncharacterized protein n=1 Tax=Apteryx owenii TaxID=8824 RepID=A0A8B9PQQ2_APTOW